LVTTHNGQPEGLASNVRSVGWIFICCISRGFGTIPKTNRANTGELPRIDIEQRSLSVYDVVAA
jgi:hypothetical protein